MPDRVSPLVRSKIMASVGTSDTGPELALRKSLHRLGWRYRTNVSALPGRPDLVFPAFRKIVFVHGCFWHGHSCRWGRLPQSRPEYWQPKIAANRSRDARVLRKLRRSGWSVLVVWQCQLRQLDKTIARVIRFLQKKRPARRAK
jgi:DNA mismatch endonuclease (patch repair protein)